MLQKHNRIRILHVTFNMGFGGTEQVIRQLVSQLDPDRYECEIACIDGEIGALGQAMKADLGTTIHAHKRNPGLDWPTIFWLRKVIKKGHFDVVHCHQYSPYVYGWLAHWGTGVRLVFTEHGRFYPDTHRKKARWVNPIMAYTTNSLVAISNSTKEALVEFEYMPSRRIKVIYNGIEQLQVASAEASELKAKLAIKPNEIVIGTVSRLDAVKNQKLILKATRNLINKGYPVRTILVGDGPEMPHLKSLARSLNIEKETVFTGYKINPACYLSIMDVFVLPSFTEGTSMTLLEAMSLGIPTVATNVGGTPEIIENGKSGIIVESNDLEAFTDAIKLMITDKNTKNDASINSRRAFFQKFESKIMKNQYEKCYRQ